MKKLICYILTAIFLLLPLTTVAYAEEPDPEVYHAVDSLHLSNEAMIMLEAYFAPAKISKVMMVQSHTYKDTLGRDYSMRYLLWEAPETFIVWVTNGDRESLHACSFIDGELRTNGFISDLRQIDLLFQAAESANELFANTAATKHLTDLKILQTHCFYSEEEGFLIYFKTNHGEFIWHSPVYSLYSFSEEAWVDPVTYLMPLEIFNDVMKLVYAEHRYVLDVQPGIIGGTADIYTIRKQYDLTPYVVGEVDFPQGYEDGGRTPDEVAAYEQAKREQNAGNSGESNDTPDESGCKSVISGGAGGLLLCGAALALLSKKKKRSL